MMLLMIAAALAAAEEPPPPPAMAAAVAAWNECIQDKLDDADDEAKPKDVARDISAACEPSAQAMLTEHRSWVESSTLSSGEKRQALRSMEKSVSSMTKMIEMMVKASRDD
jgi:hypothetical protein